MNGRGSRKRVRKSNPTASRLKDWPLTIFHRRFNSVQYSSSWNTKADGRRIVNDSLSPTKRTASKAASRFGALGSEETGAEPNQVFATVATMPVAQDSCPASIAL